MLCMTFGRLTNAKPKIENPLNWEVDSPSLLPQLHLEALDLPVHDGELLRPEAPLLKLLVQAQAEGASQR